MKNHKIDMFAILLVTAIYILALAAVATSLFATDTSDWFEPKTENATLEIQHNGTGQTVNPQLTVDGATLQGAGL